MSDGFVTVGQCVEGLPLGRFVWELLFCCFLAWLMLGAINESAPLAFSYTAQAPDWPTDEAHMSMMAAALALGNLVAALAVGWAADRHGRAAVVRPALLLTVSCGMVLQTARTLLQALVARLLLGLASGAVLAVLPALVAELLPARNRGFYLTIWCTGWPAGALMSVLVGCLSPGMSWRAFHTLTLIPALVVYACAKADMLPESPRYLYLVGRREEGYNTLLDIYDKEQLPLPWASETIAVTTSSPPTQAASSADNYECHAACKSGSASHGPVWVWLGAAVFFTSAAAQSVKIWTPTLLSSRRTFSAEEAVVGALTAGSLAGARTALMRHRWHFLPGASGTVLSLLGMAHYPSARAEPDYHLVLILAQAYAVEVLGIILCAYASTWVRRKQLVQWSLPAAALFTLLVIGASEGGASLLCGPLVGLQLAAQACSLNFLQVFAMEHFPTSHRAKAAALTSFAAQLGDFAVPVFGGLALDRVSAGGAVCAFSALYAVAWAATLRLPSVARDRPLHDVDEPRCQKEAGSRVRKREFMSYQTM